jgi:hypothetical protein
MRAHSNRWLALLTIVGGAAVALGLTAAGCGGSVDDPATTTDTGTPDTGSIVIVDSSKPDTGTVMPDTEMTYDVPGSLFDATIPDVVFEGGKTASGCYGCALTSCKKESEECDKDPRCRGLFLCVVSECAASFTDLACAFGCAGKFGVSSPSDPVVGKVQTLGTCVQNKCSAECPSAPDAAGADTKKADVASDGMADGSAFMIFPEGSKAGAKAQSIDPKVAEILMQLGATFDGRPAARDELINQFNAH